MRNRLSPELLGVLGAAVLVLLGVLGFLPGITRHYSQLHFWRSASHAQLFGVFRVSVLLDLVYVVSGLVGLAVSRTPVGARLFLIWGSIGFLSLWVYGLVVRSREESNVLPLDHNDSRLHIGLAAGLLVLAWVAAHRHRPEAPPPPSTVTRRALEGVERDLAAGRQPEALPTLAWLAGRTIALDEEELHGAGRRAALLLAAGGDPHRGLDLDGRAVTSLAAEMDGPERRHELIEGLARLRAESEGLPLVSEALWELKADGELAWRAFACALLAEELEG
jgi:hypothetical protein